MTVSTVEIPLSTNNIDDYRKFLRIKQLPSYDIRGGFAVIPKDYAGEFVPTQSDKVTNYVPSDFLFDYQRDITRMALRKKKFSIFADCGLGKTLIYSEYAKAVDAVLASDKKILMICPLMVVDQTLEEYAKWYPGWEGFERIKSKDLAGWLVGDGRMGITNFEALNADLDTSRVGCIIVDESSLLKSHYGKWGTAIIRMGRGVEWKLCGTGTPAPNDRIEYANHAVFMDAFPGVNSFLAKYFINRGQTQERWQLKAHAIEPFYRSLSHWCIFLANPGTYGWKDCTDRIPPIHVTIHGVPATDAQTKALQELTGNLIVTTAGGIGTRSKIGQIAKGKYRGSPIATNKPSAIKQLVDSWPDESTIIWCIYNDEQSIMERTFPGAASMSGDTPLSDRQKMISDFKSGKTKILITKPKILGFGLNLQVATRHVFSGLQDSYESYYQAVKRSNRIGSPRPLNVHIPVVDCERPMVENVLRKCHMVEEDTAAQERIFCANTYR